jgi:hypothetical protein
MSRALCIMSRAFRLFKRSRRGRDRMVVGFTTTGGSMQSVPLLV